VVSSPEIWSQKPPPWMKVSGLRGENVNGKTCRQTTRSTLLFCFDASTAFGKFRYGVIVLFDALWGSDVETKFVVAAAVGTIVCAIVHECFSHMVSKLEASLGGRVGLRASWHKISQDILV
jgi:hypothetical protein